METIGLKMSGGEELLAKLLSTTSEGYKVSHVRQLVPSGNGVGLVSWVMLAPDAEVFINLTAVACSFKLDSDIEKTYLGQVSGIQLLG